MRVDFTIPSAPVPKSRPRFNTNTGRAFTDDKTRIFESLSLKCLKVIVKRKG